MSRDGQRRRLRRAGAGSQPPAASARVLRDRSGRAWPPGRRHRTSQSACSGGGGALPAPPAAALPARAAALPAAALLLGRLLTRLGTGLLLWLSRPAPAPPWYWPCQSSQATPGAGARSRRRACGRAPPIRTGSNRRRKAAVTAIPCVRHLDRGIGVADPDRCRGVGVPQNQPSVCSSVVPVLPAAAGRNTLPSGAGEHVLPENRVTSAATASGNALLLRPAPGGPLVDLAVREDDAANRDRLQ
jgi:hypothetical protein